MNLLGNALTVSLGVLSLALAYLTVRGFARYWEARSTPQLAWASGLALAAAAMAIEAAVYAGVVDSPLLQAYVFLSAAIVGVLSLGATRVLRNPRVETVYSAYTLVACGAVGIASALIPVDPAAMVSAGIIVGNPPLLLLILSSLVTGPATIVLLTSAAVSLRRSWKWQTLLLIGGALILGAGGFLYIASFPVALYYAEFVGIILLFFGLISLPKVPTTTPVPATASHA